VTRLSRQEDVRDGADAASLHGRREVGEKMAVISR